MLRLPTRVVLTSFNVLSSKSGMGLRLKSSVGCGRRGGVLVGSVYVE